MSLKENVSTEGLSFESRMRLDDSQAGHNQDSNHAYLYTTAISLKSLIKEY